MDLSALLRNEVEGVSSLASTKGITLETSGPNIPCMVVGNMHLLARSVVNLLDNALRYAGEGGTIHVRWCQKDEAVVFSVEDTGPGINAEDLPHIFTPFYRGKASHTRDGGAGLGLAVSQRILRAHGGDLVARNVPLHGAIITGTLLIVGHVDSPISPEVSGAPADLSSAR